MEQVVVITGAGGGLGSIFAKEFAKDGRKVAILDFNLEAAGRVAEEIRASGGRAAAFSCDVTDKASLEAARRNVRETFGACDVLINCAGIQDPLAKTTKEAYEPGDELGTETDDESRTLFNLDGSRLLKVMNVNWLGTFTACQVFAVDRCV